MFPPQTEKYSVRDKNMSSDIDRVIDGEEKTRIAAMFLRHPNLKIRKMRSIQHRRAAVEHDMRRRDGKMQRTRPGICENARGWRGEQKDASDEIGQNGRI
jgi:hypothetical protein